MDAIAAKLTIRSNFIIHFYVLPRMCERVNNESKIQTLPNKLYSKNQAIPKTTRMVLK